MYENDGAAQPRRSAYQVLKMRGMTQRYYFLGQQFYQPSGHRNPVNEWAWITSCLEFEDELLQTAKCGGSVHQ